MGTFQLSGTWAPPLGGAVSTADIEAKLRKLMSIDYERHNWSWLLDLNIPPVPLVLPRVGALGKRQLAPEPEVSTWDESSHVPRRRACSGSEPNDHRSWKVKGPGIDDSYQEKGSSSAFTSFAPWVSSWFLWFPLG